MEKEKRAKDELVNIPIAGTIIRCPKCNTPIEVAFDVELEGLMELAKMQSALKEKKETDDKG